MDARTFLVTLTATPENCPTLTSSVSRPISIESPITGIRYPAKNLVQNSPTLLQARQFGIVYDWSPKIGLSSYSINNPTFNFNRETEYKIEIKAQSGCLTIDTQLVRIFTQADIKVPTAFTPNNDGLNDKFEFFLIGVQKLNFLRIFNRWGELVFETNSDKQFWDGTHNGIKQPSGVFVWYVDGVAADNTRIFKKGLVTLIRK